ncbi:MAG TPA: ORF6N domain-containing protein [Rhodothermales bacterium]
MAREKPGRSDIVVSSDQITRAIMLIRGQKVMLDEDLADLYEVETKVLNRAVKRNLDRFPEDFMFQLTAKEFADLRFQSGTSSLRSQIVTSSWGGIRRASAIASLIRVCVLNAKRDKLWPVAMRH